MSAAMQHVTRDPSRDQDRSLPDDLRGLVDDARGYAQAELAFQKVRAGYIGSQVPRIAIYGLLALLFAFFALGGLVVGLIIALAPLLTPWGSMAVVCVALLIGAVICVLLARSKWRAIMAAFSGESAT